MWEIYYHFLHFEIKDITECPEEAEITLKSFCHVFWEISFTPVSVIETKEMF